MRSRQRGASYIPLIIVIVLLVVAVVWAYDRTSTAQDLELQLAKKEAELEKENEARADAYGYLTQLGNQLGWPIEAATAEKLEAYKVDVDKVEQWVGEKLEELRKLEREFPRQGYVFTDDGGIQVEETGDRVTVRYLQVASIPRETQVQSLYAYMSSAMDRMLVDLQSVVDELENEKNKYDTYRESHREALNEKDTSLADLREQNVALQTAKAESERALGDEISALKDQVRELEDERDNIQEELRSEKVRLNNELLAKEQQIRKLAQRKYRRETPVGPDGEILAVTAGQDLAVINRGKAHHLQGSTTFRVYTYGKGAQKIYKGTVVVLDVNDTTSKVRIVELMNPMNPIVAGDEIESVSYNPDEVLSFVLIGRFRKYGKSDAERVLKGLGVNVMSEVTVDTDFLVMGAPETEEQNLRDTDEYKRASELGIKVITEEDLSTFLRY